jgi:hypothetical protein
MQYSIKEMTLGEILDQAVQLTRDNFKGLITVAAILYGPFVLASQIATEIQKNQSPIGISPASLLLTLATLVFGIPLANAAVITMLSNKYLGTPVSVGFAIRRSLHFFFPLIITFMVMYVFTVLGFLLLIIPGLILAFRYMLVSQVVVIEDTAYLKALGRSWRLMRGNVGKGFVLGLLIGVISVGVGMIASLVPVQTIAILITTLINLVTFVFSAAAFVVLYFSARCKHENFDLHVLAGQLQQNAARADMAYSATQ